MFIIKSNGKARPRDISFRFSRKRLGWNKSCEFGSECRFFDLSRCLGSCVGVAFPPAGWVSTAHSQCEVLVLGEAVCAIETWCKGYFPGAVVALRSTVPCGDSLYRSSRVLV